jgi:hypothetical protein
MSILPDTLVPGRMPDLFAGAPMLLMGRYQGKPQGTVVLRGVDPLGEHWHDAITASVRDNPAIAAVWARGRIRELEDRYVLAGRDSEAIEQQIVATSLTFGVLSRFTAYVAVDSSEVVNSSGEVHRVTQPVELPQGWDHMELPSVCFSAASMVRGAGARPPLAFRGPEESPRVLGKRYSLEESAPSFEASESAQFSLGRASAQPPIPTDETLGLTDHPRTWTSPPNSVGAEDQGFWARLFNLLRQWLARGALPSSLDISRCRQLARSLSLRLDEAMAMNGPSTAQLVAVHSIAQDLGDLLDALKHLNATGPEIDPLEEVHQLLSLALVASPSDPVALLEMMSRTKAALDAFCR